jgi:hypothetical protein
LSFGDNVQLTEALYQYNATLLSDLAKLCGCNRNKRKDDLVRCIHKTLTTPASLRDLWHKLDDLSKKAVAAAYHSEGEFNPTAFAAQYGSLPKRILGRWEWEYRPLVLDLFLYTPNAHHLSRYSQLPYHATIPSDLLPLLADLVSSPDKFQLSGVREAPKTAPHGKRRPVELTCTETEQAGLHDLIAYLRLVKEGKIPTDATSGRTNLAGLKQIAANLLQGDFFPLPLDGKYRANQIIRPFGLDVFARESGLVKKGKLSEAGLAFYQTQDVEILLEAFETWTRQGHFDELSRVSGLKGQRSRSARLTKPPIRREPIIEALSWCPAGVWIELEDFYRAIKIWRFDFEVEVSGLSNLYVVDKDYGVLYGDDYWKVVKGLYVKVVLWEYLGSIGVLDLLYSHPEDTLPPVNAPVFEFSDEPLSPYDGLQYFRINNLGAYLLGQAGEYVPSQSLSQPLFIISADLTMTLTNPAELSPNQRSLLEQIAAPLTRRRYQLDTQRLLSTLEAGGDLDQLADFLQKRHAGPLPAEAQAWLEQMRQRSEAFKSGGPALLIKTKSADLLELVLADPVLQKFCYAVDQKTLVIPANKEKALHARLKELEYVILS